MHKFLHHLPLSSFMNRKEKLEIFRSFSAEDILEYAEKLEDDLLEEFVESFEKFNSELEENVNKKITIVKNKKTNFNLLMKRTWLTLKDTEKEKMAKFFSELENAVK
ncbi:hypothetical protein NGRA_1764 [Nosema granulosis]|uniref:Uncharacterized protein n=1 Tax=Nosema granulosis TaxID=83296 RepID=A0A9P6GYD1_9MICR|nr:hypothetical protein NGRA_1764 [Nosema granulosis]